MTPQARPGPSGGEGSAIELLPWWVVGGVMVISFVAWPFFSQGWILPLIIVPLGLGWIALQLWMGHAESAHSRRATGDNAAARRRLIPLTVFVVAGVVWFMLVMELTTSFA
jgi:hypothetical protein